MSTSDTTLVPVAVPDDLSALSLVHLSEWSSAGRISRCGAPLNRRHVAFGTGWWNYWHHPEKCQLCDELHEWCPRCFPTRYGQ